MKPTKIVVVETMPAQIFRAIQGCNSQPAAPFDVGSVYNLIANMDMETTKILSPSYRGSDGWSPECAIQALIDHPLHSGVLLDVIDRLNSHIDVSFVTNSELASAISTRRMLTEVLKRVVRRGQKSKMSAFIRNRMAQ